MLFRKFFLFKIELFKIARKTQILRILRGRMNQNVIFCVQKIFQNLLFKNEFFFKIVLLKKIIFIKIRRVVNILIENLTRWKIFTSKSDAL